MAISDVNRVAKVLLQIAEDDQIPLKDRLEAVRIFRELKTEFRPKRRERHEKKRTNLL